MAAIATANPEIPVRGQVCVSFVWGAVGLQQAGTPAFESVCMRDCGCSEGQGVGCWQFASRACLHRGCREQVLLGHSHVLDLGGEPSNQGVQARNVISSKFELNHSIKKHIIGGGSEAI